MTQYWLVGDDATVGLPEGTTTDLRTPNTTEETTAASPTTSAKPSPKPAPRPTSSTTSQSTSRPTSTTAPTPTSTGSAAAEDRRKLIEAGHMDMALAAEGSSIGAMLIDDSDPHNQAKRESGSFIFAVPDAARKTLPEGARESFPEPPEAMWILPQAQEKNLPWLGFSTTRVGADALSQGSKVTVSMRDVSGPGRIYTWHEDLRGLRVELDSGDASKQLEYPVNAHDHQGFGFTEPGVYTATFTFAGTSASGEDFSEDLVATFAVGDEAVAAARDGRLGDAGASGAGAGKGKLTLPGALAEGIRSLEKEIKKAGDTLAPLARKTNDGGKGGSGAVSTLATPAAPAAKDRRQSSGPAHAQQPAPAQAAPAQAAPARAEEPASAKPAAQVQRAPERSRASKSSSKPSNQQTSKSKPSADSREDSKSAKPTRSTSSPATSEAPAAPDDYAPSRNPAGGGTGIHSSLDAAGAQPDGQAADTSPTAGGFWAGLAIGVGVMALIGGCVLFVAAARLLRRVERSAS